MFRLRHVPVLLLAAVALRGQSSGRDQARAADLNFIANQLPGLHINFFATLNPADFQRAVSQLTEQIPTATDAEFTVGLAQLVSMAGDPHTSLYFSGSAMQNLGFRQFPLTFRWLDDGVFVTSAAAQYSAALGSQLVRVGDYSIGEAAARLATVIPYTTPQWLHHVAAQYLSMQQVLQGLRLLPSTATSQLTFRDRSGAEFTLEVAAQPAAINGMPDPVDGPLPLYLLNTTANYWFTYLPDLRLLYLKYNKCQDDPANRFAAFSDRVWQTFDSNPVDTLVVDFRGNGGGSDSVINPFFLGIVERAPALASNPDFRIYSVIDKGTFSSGVIDAAEMAKPLIGYVAAVFGGLDLSGTIRIIGESTGGALGGAGEVLNFVLPGSKLAGQYSTKMISYPDDAGFPVGPTVEPDIAVPTRSADYFARHDPVLAAIMARWEGMGAPPSGDLITVNGASLRAEQGLAPGSLASGFGAFAATPDAVQVNGAAAQILNATGTEVDFIVPDSLAPGPAIVSVLASAQVIATGKATLTAAGPGIFVAQSADPSQPGNILNEDSMPNGPSSRAAKGSVIQIYATGHGPIDASGTGAVRVFIGNQRADVVSSGPAPGAPGRWQINARVPEGATGQLPVYLVAGHIASNGATVWVR